MDGNVVTGGNARHDPLGTFTTTIPAGNPDIFNHGFTGYSHNLQLLVKGVAIETNIVRKPFVKWTVTIVGAFLLLLLLCGGGYYALRNVHCIIDCAPVRSFEVTDMGVPLEYFPPGAQYVLPMSSRRVDQPEVARLGSMGVVWQEYPDAALNVYRFWTEKGSRKAFLGITASHAPTLRPDGRIQFKSDIADEFNYGCGISEFGGFRCTFVTRYEEFIIAFNSDMDDGMMTPDYFNQIFEYIDDRMTVHLGGDK